MHLSHRLAAVSSKAVVLLLVIKRYLLLPLFLRALGLVLCCYAVLSCAIKQPPLSCESETEGPRV